MSMLVLDANDVVRLLRSEVERAGGLSVYSRKVGLDRVQVYRTLNRELGLARRVLDTLDLRVVYTFKQRGLKSGEDVVSKSTGEGLSRTPRVSMAHRPGIEVTRVSTRANTYRQWRVFIKGRQVKAYSSEAALLALLNDNRGRVVPYGLLIQKLHFRSTTSGQAKKLHILRQHMRSLKHILDSHKAGYVVALIRQVGYALCEI
jgi:DNA-binding winged helix-turn-helix (wHTH) protein